MLFLQGSLNHKISQRREGENEFETPHNRRQHKCVFLGWNKIQIWQNWQLQPFCKLINSLVSTSKAAKNSFAFWYFSLFLRKEGKIKLLIVQVTYTSTVKQSLQNIHKILTWLTRFPWEDSTLFFLLEFSTKT